MDINQLRKYRFQLNQPFVNSKGQGIAIFDFSITFLIAYIIEPYIRFEGLVGEQSTMFFKDPSGNALEFKSFKDPSQIFAS